MTDADGELFVVPANEATWEDLQTVFCSRGPAAPRPGVSVSGQAAAQTLRRVVMRIDF